MHHETLLSNLRKTKLLLHLTQMNLTKMLMNENSKTHTVHTV